jgi:hypothetical protein
MTSPPKLLKIFELTMLISLTKTLSGKEQKIEELERALSSRREKFLRLGISLSFCSENMRRP